MLMMIMISMNMLLVCLHTTADTLFIVLKDLICCDLPLSCCRGQAYMMVLQLCKKKVETGTLIRKEVPAAFPVHCLAHY